MLERYKGIGVEREKEKEVGSIREGRKLQRTGNDTRDFLSSLCLEHFSFALSLGHTIFTDVISPSASAFSMRIFFEAVPRSNKPEKPVSDPTNFQRRLKT